MTVARSVAEVVRDHITLELEGIDRMYLNVYVPQLQYEGGVVGFFRQHRQMPIVSSALMDPISKAFVANIHALVGQRGVQLIAFAKGQRKDHVMAEKLKEFTADEGVVFVGRAQEKTPVFRTEKRRNAKTGKTYPWLVRSTAMVNQFYFYCVDRDFGPFFLKFGTYFPYTAKLCINGHEYLKRQLTREGIAFEALDNGILSCQRPQRAQQILDELSESHIDTLLRKWLRRLPHPFSAADRAAGYRYQISILQAEFSLTQVLDRPVTGRIFFEQVIRDNLDIGRPDQVALIFQRRVTRRTPGRFRTRVITEGVVPSLHFDYKQTRIKQYFKEGRALRTETTINNTHDFRIGRGLRHLPQLRTIGFSANRRLLDVQRISQDCSIGEDAFDQIQKPVIAQDQRGASLRFSDARVRALLSSLVLFRLLPMGFANRDLREQLAPLLGVDSSTMTQGKMTYDLRRLRLHGFIERVPKSHRYRVTSFGLRAALFLTRSYARVFRSGLAIVVPDQARDDCNLRRGFDHVQNAIDAFCDDAHLAA
jgi:hypothetical protein